MACRISQKSRETVMCTVITYKVLYEKLPESHHVKYFYNHPFNPVFPIVVEAKGREGWSPVICSEQCIPLFILLNQILEIITLHREKLSTKARLSRLTTANEHQTKSPHLCMRKGNKRYRLGKKKYNCADDMVISMEKTLKNH